MNVEIILSNKGQDVATIRLSETVDTTIETLVSQNIGALVVSEKGENVDGMISERDIIHALARHRTDLRWLTVTKS